MWYGMIDIYLKLLFGDLKKMIEYECPKCGNIVKVEKRACLTCPNCGFHECGTELSV